MPLPEVRFSVPRGWHEQPFSLELLSPAEGASIRYTLDGSEPTLRHGHLYSASLRITNTTTLRAAAFKDGARVSTVGTHSYIFLADVLRQPAAPPGLPAGSKAWNGEPSAYQVDARTVNDPQFAARLPAAFASLPTVSIVCSQNDMFGPQGLYLNTLERGEEWERACSTEMILTNGQTAFQVDCGVRIHGNMNRVPENSPKHAFRLSFKAKYGPGKLRYPLFPGSSVTNFDSIVLRADYNNSWIHWDPAQRVRGQRIRDAWVKDTARDMGWLAPHNRYVHLFLNGLYWGIYDFTERPDANFLAAHLGGKKNDYDVINEDEAKDGDTTAYDALRMIENLASPEGLQRVQQVLNLTNYIDFLLVNYYAGNLDWAENKNCYLVRRRTPSGPFQFVVWDGEHVLNDVSDNVVNRRDKEKFPLATGLMENGEFRRLFSERVKKHCFGDGALTQQASLQRWMKRAAEVDTAMLAESARWGYHRRNPPFTRDRDYITEQRRLIMMYFPQRTWLLKKQLTQAGLLIQRTDR